MAGSWVYKIYKHAGHYFAYYRQCDEGTEVNNVRLDLLQSIPTDPVAFSEWLQARRAHLDSRLEQWNLGGEAVAPVQVEQVPESEVLLETEGHDLQDDASDDSNSSVEFEDITLEAPTRDSDMPSLCMHELDLDTLVFSIERFPVFGLDHMPSEDNFLDWIGKNHYGALGYSDDTPIEYRYTSSPKWIESCQPQRLVEPDSSLRETYARCSSTSESPSSASHLLVHELLSLSPRPSLTERAREHLLEVLVGHAIRPEHISLHLHQLTTVPDRNHIPNATHAIASGFIRLIFEPMVFHTASPPAPPTCGRVDSDFLWPRDDVCVRVCTHLCDVENLRTAVAQIILEIESSFSRGVNIARYYGVAFSIFHCAVIRIAKTDNGELRFRHTPALQFLPSWYATSPSTPGISALARLSYLPDASIVEKVARIYKLSFLLRHPIPLIGTPPGRQTRNLLAEAPSEILQEIADYLPPAHLIKFASICPRTRITAAKMLRAPSIDDYRLIAPFQLPLPGDMSTFNAYVQSYPWKGYISLFTGCFKALSSHNNATLMHVGQIPLRHWSTTTTVATHGINLSSFEDRRYGIRLEPPHLLYHVIKLREPEVPPDRNQ